MLWRTQANVKRRKFSAAAIAESVPAGASAAFFCPERGCRYYGGDFFSCKQLLAEHYQRSHTARRLACPRPGCGKRYAVMKDMASHLHACGAPRVRCAGCGVDFGSRAAARKHVRNANSAAARQKKETLLLAAARGAAARRAAVAAARVVHTLDEASVLENGEWIAALEMQALAAHAVAGTKMAAPPSSLVPPAPAAAAAAVAAARKPVLQASL